jgi:hypothetical protein
MAAARDSAWANGTPPSLRVAITRVGWSTSLVASGVGDANQVSAFDQQI